MRRWEGRTFSWKAVAATGGSKDAALVTYFDESGTKKIRLYLKQRRMLTCEDSLFGVSSQLCLQSLYSPSSFFFYLLLISWWWCLCWESCQTFRLNRVGRREVYPPPSRKLSSRAIDLPSTPFSLCFHTEKCTLNKRLYSLWFLNAPRKLTHFPLCRGIVSPTASRALQYLFI